MRGTWWCSRSATPICWSLADRDASHSVQAQVATAKVSLDQAVANHEAGTAPMLDELRARVDYQSLEQQLIVAKNALEKDKLALARTIGLPLAQSFNAYRHGALRGIRPAGRGRGHSQAQANRKDLAAMVEQTKAAAAAAQGCHGRPLSDRRNSTQTTATSASSWAIRTAQCDATGTLSVPVFKEFALRGEAQPAQAQLDTTQAQLSDKNAQVEADIRDALLDIASAQKQVEVARSSVDLANEALNEAQERYANGVSDNLAVSQAEQSVAQANNQYVASLYRHNVAKLSLARAWAPGRITRNIWEGSKRGGYNSNTSPNDRAGPETEIDAAADPPQGHHRGCDRGPGAGRRRGLVALHLQRRY